MGPLRLAKMIEATRRKLGEARFFYQHLVSERQRPTRHNPETFRYYFSAFIQAARNVLWALHSEEKENWEAWEPGWEETLTTEERKLLKLTKKLRNIEVKEGGVNPSVELEEVALHELLSANLDVEPWPIAAYPHHRRKLPGVPPSAAFRPAYYFEHEDGKEEVTALCQRYLVLLEKVVEDFCADTFPASK
jgi:hypothetical protein